MTWTNIADIPGLTVTVDQGGGTHGAAAVADIGSVCSVAPLLALVSHELRATHAPGDAGWVSVEIRIADSAGAIAYPCNIRVTVTATLRITGGTSGNGQVYTGDFSGGAGILPEEDGVSHTASTTGILTADGDLLLQAFYSASGEYFDAFRAVIEVDGADAPPAEAKWTDFVGTVEEEDGTLRKTAATIYIPAVEAVQGYPASHDCYPPPPPNPTPDPPPPGGNGSGPPHGDCTYVDVYGQVTMCSNSDPHGPLLLPLGSPGAVPPCVTVFGVVGQIRVCP